MYITYLLLGSNLGNRRKYIKSAISEIEAKLGSIAQRSSIYQTASWGKHDQPDFLNQVIELKTILKPQDLLSGILSIEADLGRKRVEKWGSRIIDIDILLYEDQVINEAELIIPHPYLAFRRFCLMPLFEIAPEFIHPVLKKNIQELLLELSDDLFVKRLS
ncbi:MAG: 2-amino-4-hydroxy-6-hydroxymethyldihydropteridine diphosphokinase [Sphingobacteriales bacterium 17-39-43]|uniref:2-amino-4-hydroxy-6- hydroxymethyldihydropteridine diphosphokinase n=1 Tax=Daejeonella sp. TaxID=2805397 RepID=UPI000BC39F04|nr:2-amino-4-hydroxy-6-hydroxymethyldihydropteridine diphosphokinase [Daejeonella sp.]OYZ33186.1 MAG: 2-amino-4-hydroxy-6-hydroxymethyldihydropteridine diphosphokinase [Sphingobacteriales bacterium 16-39-50]OZA26595.1 MAG: 2-amino-4-hydroxy-6-hydroxymethyldihydropteridine diphosphokinase [Sphingobacteriales bacterium 17-39-43]HQT21751.1 2-amino-4-hydroxy-6-hydroxymethyldihydropteridine diphosphokinase [Daejeonella sp.]HQT56482.1 2-amino-4-hydroxy-6-hydroxymethyldihydropteridine diphosphokinase 